MTFLLLMELTSSKYTTLAGNLALISYTLAEIFITIFAYLAHDWLKLKWFNNGFYALTLFYLYFVPESPYWLFNRKKFSQLETCLRNIATTNGRADTEWFPFFEELIKTLPVTHETAKPVITKTRFSRHIFLRLGASGCIGFITMLLYIKISYGLATMDSAINPYWNIILGAVVEAIGYVSASILMITRLGRRFSLLSYALLTSVCVIVIPFVKETHPLVVVIVSQIGKLTISGAVSVSWIYVPELFPTSKRGFGNAVLVFFGRLGAILAPIIDVALGDRYIRITFYVYSVLALVIVGLLFILPETRNRSFDSHNEDDAKSVVSNTYTNEIMIEDSIDNRSIHFKAV
ncbi:unnamed protein product [Rotaria sp. Silwood1]|nr:unnamed protein product [Rotaria sp. Silwood1]